MPSIVGGPWTWVGGMDDEGHRTYKLTFRIKALPTEGPASVLQTPGLAVPGSTYLIDDDLDVWAYCLPTKEARPEREGEPNEFWKVTQTFTTKPPSPDKQRDNTSPIGDPLLEPQKVSGSMLEKTEEATHDRYGNPITTSSHEQIRGPQNEWDADGGDTVIVEQNVADLELALLSNMRNWVNDSPLWGLPARCVRFRRYSWDKKFYGTGPAYYYTRRLEFEANRKGFDRDILDEGTKVLKGHWDIMGSGATLNITASGGAITGATLGAGGTGYTPSTSLNLIVTGGGGSGGVVKVTTNSSGAVSAVSSVAQGGTGYSTTSGAATRAEALGWVDDQVNGLDPDPNNPTHFIRYQDPNGNMARVVLDGHGRPFDPDKATNFTDDGTAVLGTAPPGTNTSGVAVPTGITAILRDGGSLLASNAYTFAVTSVTAAGESTVSADVNITTNTTHKTVRLSWPAVPGATGYRIYRYNAGFKLVGESADANTPGSIHVEKYNEGNLLLLGIPTTF